MACELYCYLDSALNSFREQRGVTHLGATGRWGVLLATLSLNWDFFAASQRLFLRKRDVTDFFQCFAGTTSGRLSHGGGPGFWVPLDARGAVLYVYLPPPPPQHGRGSWNRIVCHEPHGTTYYKNACSHASLADPRDWKSCKYLQRCFVAVHQSPMICALWCPPTSRNVCEAPDQRMNDE